jgi:hypothetical protein
LSAKEVFKPAEQHEPLVRDIVEAVGDDALGVRIRNSMCFSFGNLPRSWLLDQLRAIRAIQQASGRTLAEICAARPNDEVFYQSRRQLVLPCGRNLGAKSIERLLTVFLPK